jgi:hypothetical protein
VGAGPAGGRALWFVAVIGASVGVFLAVLGAGVESAEPIVRWDAPPGCGTASELRDRVTRQLGTLEADVEIVGRVRQEGGLHVLELELVIGGERRRRSFSAEDCSTLLDAAAIVSSAALGPEGGIEAVEGVEAGIVPEPAGAAVNVPEPGTAGEPKPAAVAEPRPASEPASTVPPIVRERPSASVSEPAFTSATSRSRSRRPGRWILSARGGIGFDGALAPPVGSLGFGRAWARWRVQALVDAFGGRARGPNGALDLRVVTVTPRACATIRPRARIELLPCAGVAAGMAIGQGRDVLNPRTATLPWIAAQLDFGVLAVPRPWLAVGIELSNYALLGWPRFALSDEETVFRLNPVGMRALVTIELRFSATEPAAAGH